MTAPTTIERLRGPWTNELDSWMELEARPDGTLTGHYRSSVGADGGPQPLAGYYDPRPENGIAVLGFTVAWPTTHTVTVWSGRYDTERDVITATWLLSGEVDRVDAWRSTLVGADVFTRSGAGGGGAGGTREEGAAHASTPG